jgi:hypothetical protein
MTNLFFIDQHNSLLSDKMKHEYNQIQFLTYHCLILNIRGTYGRHFENMFTTHTCIGNFIFSVTFSLDTEVLFTHPW